MKKFILNEGFILSEKFILNEADENIATKPITLQQSIDTILTWISSNLINGQNGLKMDFIVDKIDAETSKKYAAELQQISKDLILCKSKKVGTKTEEEIIQLITVGLKSLNRATKWQTIVTELKDLTAEIKTRLDKVSTDTGADTNKAAAEVDWEAKLKDPNEDKNKVWNDWYKATFPDPGLEKFARSLGEAVTIEASALGFVPPANKNGAGNPFINFIKWLYNEQVKIDQFKYGAIHNAYINNSINSKEGGPITCKLLDVKQLYDYGPDDIITYIEYWNKAKDLGEERNEIFFEDPQSEPPTKLKSLLTIKNSLAEANVDVNKKEAVSLDDGFLNTDDNRKKAITYLIDMFEDADKEASVKQKYGVNSTDYIYNDNERKQFKRIFNPKKKNIDEVNYMSIINQLAGAKK